MTCIQPQISFIIRGKPSDKRWQMVSDEVDARPWVQSRPEVYWSTLIFAAKLKCCWTPCAPYMFKTSSVSDLVSSERYNSNLREFLYSTPGGLSCGFNQLPKEDRVFCSFLFVAVSKACLVVIDTNMLLGSRTWSFRGDGRVGSVNRQFTVLLFKLR